MPEDRSISVGFVTLGCPKNQVDTEIMEGLLEDCGFEITSPDRADVIVVNTCGFIQDAQEESIDMLLYLSQMRTRVVAVGCLVERFGRELARELPEVKTWVGLGEEHRIGEILLHHEEGVFLKKGAPLALKCWEFRRLTPTPYAYLKLAEGCDNRCAYCSIPLIRGDLRSRSKQEIIEEARLMLAAAVKEINLIAQDTTSWGVDRGEEGLLSLIDELDALPGEFWIRLLYLHPAGLSRELIERVGNGKHLLPYLEMPIQHVDHSVLEAMGRRGGAEAVERAVELVESEGNIALRTTVLVGFPAETEEAFERLCSFLKEHPPWRLTCFGYSPQEGTPASHLEPLPEEVVRERVEEILSLAEEIHWKSNMGLVGERMACLAEEPKVGRVEIQAPEIDGVVHLEEDAPVGEIFEVEVRDTDGVDLYGLPVFK